MTEKARPRLVEFAGELILTLTVALLMKACADALPISSTAHHVLDFLIEMFGG